MKSVLIVSPHFPPSTLAGVHRARHLLKHLPTHGWHTKVICVDPTHHVEKLDPELESLVPADAAIIKTGALPVSITRRFGIAGDIGLRGLAHIGAAIKQEMEASRPDVVMITGSPYYPMLLAGWIEKRWGVPVVLDFQDPWVTPVGAAAKVGTKAWLSHRIAVALEPVAIRSAAFITSVSDRQNQELAERHRCVDPARMAGIPIGGDPADFDALRDISKQKLLGAQSFPVLSYVGTALPRSAPLFRALLKGLALARTAILAPATKPIIRCVGTSNQPNDSATFRILPIASDEGVSEAVIEEPARVPFLDALGILANTSAVLMIGSDEPHYTASKIYPGMMSGRPFLALFHRASSAHSILSNAGGGIVLGFETPDELEGLPPKIAEAIVTLVTKPDSLGKVNQAAYANYTAHAVSGRFATIFDQLRNYRHSSNLLTSTK
ncbi:glycosyltransferase [Aurantiacibacter hainanensis]|uniref:glycosyltransferase n=1 Tax=Aurantiacibacter hainanensis TaxID=3076114 RepID=UPI0030C665F3